MAKTWVRPHATASTGERLQGNRSGVDLFRRRWRYPSATRHRSISWNPGTTTTIGQLAAVQNTATYGIVAALARRREVWTADGPAPSCLWELATAFEKTPSG